VRKLILKEVLNFGVRAIRGRRDYREVRCCSERVDTWSV